MEKALYYKFTKLRDEQKSVLIVGLDPKDELQEQKAVELSKLKEGIMGFKPNAAFYQSLEGQSLLQELVANAGSHIKIIDYKAPDGANTNSAVFRSYSNFDYVTIAPAGGCIEDTIKQANKVGLETISMGVMSFPGVLMDINKGYGLFEQRIIRAVEAGTSGFVMGATAYIPENKVMVVSQDLFKGGLNMPIEDINKAIRLRNDLFKFVLDITKDKEIIYLVPGFGRQNGRPEYFLDSGIDLNRCMINLGSDMFKQENPKEYIAMMNNIFKV